MIDPGLEMRRLAGKFALLFAGVYALGVFGAAIAAATGPGIPLWGWLLLPLPTIAFLPSVRDAVRLHRTTDAAQMTTLWRRCLLLAVVGMALFVAAALIIGNAS